MNHIVGRSYHISVNDQTAQFFGCQILLNLKNQIMRVRISAFQQIKKLQCFFIIRHNTPQLKNSVDTPRF